MYAILIVLINPWDEFWKFIKDSDLRKNNIIIMDIIRLKNLREILSLQMRLIIIPGIKIIIYWILRNSWRSKVDGILNNSLKAVIKFSKNGTLILTYSSLCSTSPNKDVYIRFALARNKKILNMDRIFIVYNFLLLTIFLLMK